MGALQKWSAALADLVLPVECLGCERPGIAWCEECRTAATQLRLHTPVPPPDGFPPTVAAAEYADDVRRAIIAVKDRGRRDLVAPVAELLGWATDAVTALGARVLLVPMPSDPVKARARGGEHLVRIGSRVARSRGHLLVEALHTTSHQDATSLSAASRLSERRQSMRLRRGAPEAVRGADVVLIDDVVTTGATLSVAATLIRRAGARTIRAAVVAGTQRQVGTAPARADVAGG